MKLLHFRSKILFKSTLLLQFVAKMTAKYVNSQFTERSYTQKNLSRFRRKQHQHCQKALESRKAAKKGQNALRVKFDVETRSHAVDDDNDEVADDEEDGDDAVIDGEAHFDQFNEADDNVQVAANGEKGIDALGESKMSWFE